MPTFAAYSDLMTAIEADVLAVWADTKKVHRGWPRTVQNVWPYAVIDIEQQSPLSQDWDSVQGLDQRPKISITRVNKLPVDKTASVMDVQVSDANLLIARLERNSYYQNTSGTNIAMNPVAFLAELPMPGDKEETYESVVGFACQIRRLHTSKQS